MVHHKQKFAQIVVGLPVNEVFTYSVPFHLQERIGIGMRVFVPFGKRSLTGYVIGFVDSSERSDIKELIEILDEKPIFDKNMLKLTKWVSDYYFSSWGEVLKAALPKGIDIKGYEIIKISNLGRELLEKPFSKKDARKKILEVLISSNGLKINKIREKTGIRNLSPYLLKLEEAGLITVEKKREKALDTIKKEKCIRLSAEIKNVDIIKEVCPKAPSQARLLETLFKKGELSLKEAREEIRGLSSIIKALEEKGLIQIYERECISISEKEYPSEGFLKLNPHQEKALQYILKGIDSKDFIPFLLHGITGSGKTEVYIQAIASILKQEKSALFLVPEISLTPQLVKRFKDRFGTGIAVLHSGLSSRKRLFEWERVRRNQASIVIGTRSAVFAPVKDLGIIIVDEEHDSSYKQEESPRYNGRDVAIIRAKHARIPIVLGSATPSLESFYNAKVGKYKYLHLPERIDNRPLPEVEIIDLRTLDHPQEKSVFLSPLLEEAIRGALSKKEQVLLFLNRRGFANFVMCRDCGHVFKCLNCSVSLTYYAQGKLGRCHYCGFSIKIPDTCSKCQGVRIESFGIGTQKIEDELKRLFKDYSITRVDRDSTRRKDSHEVLFHRIRNKEVDILIGTQMITKGHDFPDITLVGVILADGALNIPDFRSGERAFQLLNQVAGRAGRGKQKGRVIIQTFNPEHYSVVKTKTHDFEGFYEKEITFRRQLNYPPYARLAVVKIEGFSEKRVVDSINSLKEIFINLTKEKKEIEVLGPARGVPLKVKNRYRWVMLLKSKEVSSLNRTIRQGMAKLRKTAKGNGATHISIDMDPTRVF